ncbi:MAG TPA: ferritin-like domain-containing protein [Bryobacteraceae bacterium]|nr:ferritin-like domain-containing protein [Bryobacteraceae bacterium]
MNERTIQKSLLNFVAPESRRSFFSAAGKVFGAGAVAGIALGQGIGTGTGTVTQGDIDVLNYALTLEFLEATFYNQFLGAPGGTTQTGLVGTVTGNPKAFTSADALRSSMLSGVGSTVNANLYSYFTDIRDHELAHVAALRATIQKLGGTPVQPCSYNFNITTFDGFLATAQALENTGVSAYDGALALIQDASLQQTGATIATVEARHAAFLNLVAGGAFSSTVPPPATGTPSIPGVSGSPFPNAFDTPLTQAQVLAIAGPFLGTCTTPLPASTAIATFSPAIPSPIKQSSVTLNATASSSIAGPATFMYSVSPGGNRPAILQSPNSPQATIQFVNGPGIYNLLLTVTDVNGQTSTMPVTLNYQP